MNRSDIEYYLSRILSPVSNDGEDDIYQDNKGKRYIVRIIEVEE